MNRYRSCSVCTITSSLKPSSRYAAAARYLVTSTGVSATGGSVTSTRESGSMMRSVTSNCGSLCARPANAGVFHTMEQTEEARQGCQHYSTCPPARPRARAFSSRRPLLRSVRRPRGDPQLIRLRCAPPGCYSPLDPRLLQSSSTPTECPTTQGGSAAHPAPLRSAGLLLPPGPPPSPVVVHSYGVSDAPRGVRTPS